MPYVNVPADLSKIQTKLAFNLTKRQLVCFGAAAIVGVPTFLVSRLAVGNTAAMFLLVALMLPAFLVAMYQKDGLPFEKVAGNLIRARFLWPRIRPYKSDNFYALLSKEENIVPKAKNNPKSKRQKRAVRAGNGPADHPIPGNAPGRRVPRS